MENLSLTWKGKDFCPPSHLRLSFYQKQCQKPVLTVNLSEQEFQIGDQSLTLPASIPHALPDGNYYIKCMLEDGEQNCISQTSLTEIVISDGKCSSREISFPSPSYARILAYGDFSQTDIQASFHRYEKVDGEFYYIDTLSSSPFQGNKWDVKTANLILPCTQAEISYLLLPGQGEIIPEKHLTFVADENNIYDEINTALVSLPIAKINCVPLSESTSDMPSYIWNDKYNPPVEAHTKATKSFVRNCPTYPNTITTVYQNDGTYLSASLSISSTKDILSNSSNAIMDIYTNGKELVTTQKSYQQ